MNETIANALKHGFEEGQKGTVHISLQKSASTVLIRVKDDGIGFPEDLDLDRSGTLGLKLIGNLVREQLKGDVQIQREKGTEVIVEFPVVEGEAKGA